MNNRCRTDFADIQNNMNLLTSGRLNTYLADIDRQAQEHFERLIEGLKQAQVIKTASKGRKRLIMDRAAN